MVVVVHDGYLRGKSGYRSEIYFSTASLTTQATDTFFCSATRSISAYSSNGNVTDARATAPLVRERRLALVGMDDSGPCWCTTIHHNGAKQKEGLKYRSYGSTSVPAQYTYKRSGALQPPAAAVRPTSARALCEDSYLRRATRMPLWGREMSSDASTGRALVIAGGPAETGSVGPVGIANAPRGLPQDLNTDRLCIGSGTLRPRIARESLEHFR
jgi:hypothetical protein